MYFLFNSRRIILPERPKFWTRVESWEDIGANDEIEIKEEIFIADTEEFDTDEGNDDNNAVSGDKVNYWNKFCKHN